MTLVRTVLVSLAIGVLTYGGLVLYTAIRSTSLNGAWAAKVVVAAMVVSAVVIAAIGPIRESR